MPLNSHSFFSLMSILMFPESTRPIQPVRGCVPQSGGGTVGGEHCANCIHLPRLSGGPATQFWGKASRASPQHGWQSAYSLRETLLDVSRESGAPGDQVEETPGRASIEKLGCRTPPQLHA